MLDSDRAFFVTASLAHRVMAGFELELEGINAKLPEFEEYINLQDWINAYEKKPKVGELKEVGVKTTGAQIDEAWQYHKSQQKPFTDGMESVARDIAMSSFIVSRDEGFKSADMERGNVQEGEAITNLQNITGNKFDSITEDQRFLTRGNLGVTPDGIEYDGFRIKSCAEVKNPKDTTHMKYLHLLNNQDDLLKHVPNYYWQAQCGLHVTESDFYHWMSYHSGFNKGDDLRCVYVQIKPVQEHINILVDRSNRVIEAVPKIIESILNGRDIQLNKVA